MGVTGTIRGRTATRPMAWAGLAALLGDHGLDALGVIHGTGRRVPLTVVMVAVLVLAVHLRGTVGRQLAGVVGAAAAVALGVGLLAADPTWLPPAAALAVMVAIATAIALEGTWVRLSSSLSVVAAAFCVLVVLAHILSEESLTTTPGTTPDHGMTAGLAVALLLMASGWALRRVPVRDPHLRVLLPGLTLALVAVPLASWGLSMAGIDPGLRAALVTFVAAAGPVSAAMAAAARARRLAASLDDLQATLVRDTSYAMLLIDSEGCIRQANDAARQLFACDRLVDVPVEDLFDPDGSQDHRTRREAYMREPVAFAMDDLDEMTARRCDGVEIRVRVSLNPIPQADGPPLVGVSILDVTDLARKAADAEARASAMASALEHQVAALAALRRADQAKDLLLTSISHEIRTPLTVLIGMTDLLADPDRDLDPVVEERMRTRIRAQARSLHLLVEDLLDLGRFERGTLEPQAEAVRLVDLVRGCADRIGAQYARQVVVDVPAVTVDVDPRQIGRILDNLLSNACRYAPFGTVHVDGHTRGDRLQLAVEDEGDGIAVERRTIIFDPFERGDRIDPARPGVGIGLALVDRLARASGGTCWVETGPRAGGARFVVELPLRRSTTVPRASSTRPSDEATAVAR